MTLPKHTIVSFAVLSGAFVFASLLLVKKYGGSRTTPEEHASEEIIAEQRIVQDEVRTVVSDEKSRTYVFHVPARLDQTPAPLVIALHPEGENAQALQDSTGLNALADREGFFVAYPNGSSAGKSFSWNAQYCCGDALKNNVDDSAFIQKVYTDIVRFYPIDTKRIYLIGHSNGGMLVYHLAKTVPDLFAAGVTIGAGVPQAYTRNFPSDAPYFPFMAIHGEADDVVPFRGGSTTLTPSISVVSFDALQSFVVAAAKCTKDAVATNAARTTKTFSECRNSGEFRFQHIANGGHTLSEKNAEGISPTTEDAWDFLKMKQKKNDE